MWFSADNLKNEQMALIVRCLGPDSPNAALYIPDLGAIAQMVERLNRTQEASGSNPLSSTPHTRSSVATGCQPRVRIVSCTHYQANLDGWASSLRRFTNQGPIAGLDPFYGLSV